MDNKVIVIGAVAGGGKTTITNHLVNCFTNAKALYFDDYDFDGPNDIISWVNNGADYNDWDLQPLLADVNVLKDRYRFIIVDYPFAYQNKQLSPLIDLAVFIDTPLDIALARRILRDDQNKLTEQIFTDLGHYLDAGRDGYTQMLKCIKPNSDVVINGCQSVKAITDEIIMHMMRSNVDHC
ncbi:Uridine kinase [Amphibacillus marinus]|uniref:Uridine kinase n=1 Tax=Amphibacillus marinus TaxID=872970 RepID=A0A1H8LPT3_9BACI|nr:Uridine kinase [Amphibacillus marinus]